MRFDAAGMRFDVDDAGDGFCCFRTDVFVGVGGFPPDCFRPVLPPLLLVLSAFAFPPAWFLVSKPPALTDVEALGLASTWVNFIRAIGL